MERLTKWNGQKYILPQGRTSDGQSYWRIIAERLAAYENTGLTPEEIKRMKGEEMDKYTLRTFYAGMTGYIVYKNGVEVYHGYSVDEIIDRFGIHPDEMEEMK